MVLLSCYYWGLIDCSLRAKLYLYHSLSNTNTEGDAVRGERKNTETKPHAFLSREEASGPLLLCLVLLVPRCTWPSLFSSLASVIPGMGSKWLGEAQWGDCSLTRTLTPKLRVVSDSSLIRLIPETDAFPREGFVLARSLRGSICGQLGRVEHCGRVRSRVDHPVTGDREEGPHV